MLIAEKEYCVMQKVVEVMIENIFVLKLSRNWTHQMEVGGRGYTEEFHFRELV